VTFHAEMTILGCVLIESDKVELVIRTNSAQSNSAPFPAKNKHLLNGFEMGIITGIIERYTAWNHRNEITSYF
jgi:hypothetical protein